MSWFWNLFCLGKKSPPSKMSLEEANEIMNAYGGVLKNHLACTVTDISKLPYPKDTIKKALVFGIIGESDPYIREQLKIGYIFLADWQEGVGDVNIGMDFSHLDLSQDTQTLIEQFDKICHQGEGYEKWAPIIKAEQVQLEAELKALGI